MSARGNTPGPVADKSGKGFNENVDLWLCCRPGFAMIDLDACLEAAQAAGARSLLMIVGQPIAMRLGETVETPFGPARLTYQQTQSIVEQILPQDQVALLESQGAVEIPFRRGIIQGSATIFFGQGSHNIVLHLGL